MTSVQEMPVLVAGASGFVGSHTVRLLAARGRKVRAMVRRSSNTAALEGLPVELVYGDVLDPASLQSAFEGCGSIFYSVLDPRFWLTDTTPLYRNNVEGLINAMNAALAVGVQRFVFTSTIGTLGLSEHGPVTEDLPFNWRDRASAYIRARLAAEEELLAYCRDKALPGIVLCPAITYGPHDYQPTPHNEMLWKIADGQVRFALDAAAPTVDIRDVAEAALLAEEHGRVGERYIIANEFASNRELYALAVAQRGNPPPRLIPQSVAHALAWVAERALKLLGQKDFLVSTDAVFLANVFREMDHGKARRELHWRPRPLVETVRDAVAWFAEHTARAASPARADAAQPVRTG